MSKAKKEAYAEKQRIASATTEARSLTPLGEGAQPSAAATKHKPKKQSRGK